MSWPFGHLKMFGYDLVMIDPPWPFDLWSDAGKEKSAAAQYDCMTREQILELPVGQLLRAGGVLWLWCTWPLAAEGFHAECFRRWGVAGKTGGAWAKRTPNGLLRVGTGYLLRSVCEPFFLATIGSDREYYGSRAYNLVETFAHAGALDGLAREHSRKPDEAYELCERLMPNAWRADVFSRQPRPGWECWGKEAGKFAGATGDALS